MIEREITGRLTALFQPYRSVTVTGPRQSGKTTLCRAAFPDLEYTNLGAPDQRDFAESDPRGFLAQFDEGAILDEVQHVPELLPYLQGPRRRKGPQQPICAPGQRAIQALRHHQSVPGGTGTDRSQQYPG